MKEYEYEVLTFDTSQVGPTDMAIDLDSFGFDGYELRNTNIVGETIYVLLTPTEN